MTTPRSAAEYVDDTTRENRSIVKRVMRIMMDFIALSPLVELMALYTLPLIKLQDTLMNSIRNNAQICWIGKSSFQEDRGE